MYVAKYKNNHSTEDLDFVTSQYVSTFMMSLINSAQSQQSHEYFKSHIHSKDGVTLKWNFKEKSSP